MCSVLNILNGVILPYRLKSNSSRALTEKEMCVFSVNWPAKDRRDEGGEPLSVFAWQDSSESTGVGREGNGNQMTFLPLGLAIAQTDGGSSSWTG